MKFTHFSRFNYVLVGILASTLLTGCPALMVARVASKAAKSDSPPETSKPESTPAATPAAPAATAPKPAEKPEAATEAELIVLKATVKAIDKHKRIVTLLDETGKQFQITCGPEIVNFPQIRVGDKVTTQFFETVKIEITSNKSTPHTDQSEIIERAPKGAKPELLVVDRVEIYATVQSIDYATRQLTLLGPEGKVIKVKAGPDVARFNEIKANDTIVAHLTEAVDIKVEAPTKTGNK